MPLPFFCLPRRAQRFAFTSLAAVVSMGSITPRVFAQDAVDLQGSVTDPGGNLLPKATVAAQKDGTTRNTRIFTDSQGHFDLSGLSSGIYTVTVTAPGFAIAVRKQVQVSATSTPLTIALQISQATAEVNVDADATHSVAAALAPMDALLGETSARTEITQAFINNFTSPVADYGELVQMAPSTFTLSSDGVGLGQSKTYFRGFPDGDYDIDFDGVPFYDTNTPSHHSWAFFPSQSIGGIDFDRSPGTASTIGPTPFGGSIHLLSREFSPIDQAHFTFSGGSFNTFLYDADYESGPLLHSGKLNMLADVHHLQSHGYQSLNNQNENAGNIKIGYKLTDNTSLTGYSGVVWVDANTPNFSATRCQMYGVGSGYGCTVSGTNQLYPYTGYGLNFLNTNNSNPYLYLDTQYNYYHVPTDFEYVGVHTELGHNITLDFKPYTYNYDNSEKYANAVPITEGATINGSKTYFGMAVQPCNVQVKGKLPCGVDKYNSYRKYGETSELTQTSRFGNLRAGMWYEWANTNRHQFPSDPLNNWADQPLGNFNEKFVTDSYQPFVEYQYHVTKKFDITPGVKFAYYTVGTQQFADDGKTIGGLGTNNPNTFVSNGGSYFATLPSMVGNYRLRQNLSVYAQYAQGSVVPPSNVFDYQQGTTPGTFLPVQTLPQQQKNTTYQTGFVSKLKRVTFDADYFHIHFDNSYSSFSNQSTGGEPVFFAQPASVTQGLEGETNLYFLHGLSLYLNASYNRATYTGSQAVSCVTGTAGCTASTPQITVNTPSGLWVAQTPSDVETEGLTYQHSNWDAGFFNKRVGTEYQDNGAYHNQFTIAPFNISNLFVNYTLRSGGRLNGTKFRLSFNNLFNQSSVTGVTLVNGPATQSILANSTKYTDPFTTTSQTAINGQDNVGILAARSIMLTVTLGTSTKR